MERSNKRKHQDAELQEELRECAKQGNLDRMRELVLVQRVSVNDGDQDGKTPLILAVAFGHAQAAQFLLQNGANVDATDNESNTALGYAISSSDLALARVLLQNGANVEAYIHFAVITLTRRLNNVNKYSPIVWAMLNSNHAMVELLLQFGAKTDEVLDHGGFDVALFLACRQANMRIVQMLLDHEDGIGVNTVARGSGNIPTTPLCAVSYNIRKSHVEIAQFLIERGARVIVPGDNGNGPSPLMIAALKGNMELLRLYLKHSPFSSSTSGDNTQTPITQETDDAMYQPLSRPLLSALKKNKLEAAQLLIDYGAVKSGYPFLFGCAERGDIEGARMLLRAGAYVNQPGEDYDDDQQQHRRGETPLWIAAKNGHVKLVQEFLKAGANVSIRNSGDETPLGVAYRIGHKEIVYLLLRTSPHVWMRLKEIW